MAERREKWRGMVPVDPETLDDPMFDEMLKAVAINGFEDAADQKGWRADLDSIREIERVEMTWVETKDGPRLMPKQPWSPDGDAARIAVWFEGYAVAND